jgi:hypothetical protein
MPIPFRHAAYFAPALNSQAWDLGSQWLGRCARNSTPLDPPRFENISSELFDNLTEGDEITVQRKDGTMIKAKYINTNVVVDKKLGKDGFVPVLVNASNKGNGDRPDYRGLQFAKARDHNKVTTRVKNFFRDLFKKEKKRKGHMDERLNRLLLSGKLFRTEKGSRSSSRRTGRSSSS